MRNPSKKCLSCHCDLESKYYFCSITCACLAGFMSVNVNGSKRDMKELEDENVRNKFLNNSPLRDRFEKKGL